MGMVVLVTGTVGRTLGGALDAAGHDVAVGTRDADVTLARDQAEPASATSFTAWLADHPGVDLENNVQVVR